MTVRKPTTKKIKTKTGSKFVPVKGGLIKKKK